MAKYLDKEVLEQYFEYDPDSPSGLRWRVARHTGKCYKTTHVKAGDTAGCIRTNYSGSNYNYWYVKLKGEQYKVHRIVYCLCHNGLSNELQIDHIDGNSLNNKIENLRAVAQEINLRNSKMSVKNVSGFVGVAVITDKKTGFVRIRAAWCEEFKLKTKSFSVNKYGYDLAFELACKYREDMIAKLNEQGAGYSERHGQDE